MIMTVKELCEKTQIKILCCDALTEREIKSVYCCDLLSVVMGKAPADCAWVTIMGNINAIAVAVLVDACCVIIADQAEVDPRALDKAVEQGVILLQSSLDIFNTAKLVDSLL